MTYSYLLTVESTTRPTAYKVVLAASREAAISMGRERFGGDIIDAKQVN
jgi:hypothetical protein